jgi:hypothetical protein
MKLVRSISVAVAMTLATGTAYAKGADKKPAPAKAEVSKADAHKFLVFFDKLVDTVVADKDSCPKMATDLNHLIDANKAIMEMAKKAAAEHKDLPKDAKDHMMTSVKRMVPAMQKCGNDPKVQAAFGRLDAGTKSK